MLEVNIVKNDKSNISNVKEGQVRYNKEGVFVLIVKANHNSFDAIVLAGSSCVKPFDWNSKGQSASSIAGTYPYIGKGKLEISE